MLMLADIVCCQNDSWHCRWTVSADIDELQGAAFTVLHCIHDSST